MQRNPSSETGATEAGYVSLIEEIKTLIKKAPSVPLTSACHLNRADALGIIEDLEVMLPEELNSARRLLDERDKFLKEVNEESAEIRATARASAERLVENTQVAKEAKAYARRIVEKAEAQNRERQKELDNWCDQRLASFEIQVQKLLGRVHEMRDKLHGDIMDELDSGTGYDAGPHAQYPPGV